MHHDIAVLHGGLLERPIHDLRPTPLHIHGVVDEVVRNKIVFTSMPHHRVVPQSWRLPSKVVQRANVGNNSVKKGSNGWLRQRTMTTNNALQWLTIHNERKGFTQVLPMVGHIAAWQGMHLRARIHCAKDPSPLCRWAGRNVNPLTCVFAKCWEAPNCTNSVDKVCRVGPPVNPGSAGIANASRLSNKFRAIIQGHLPFPIRSPPTLG